MLVAKEKRSVLLVLHVPTVSVALAPRSPVASIVPVVKIAAKVAVVMGIAPASLTVPAVKIVAKVAVVMGIAPASLTVPAVKIVAKEAVQRKKMKEDCGLMIASDTAMKRGVNVLEISVLSISRPSLEVAMSSH